MRGAYPGDAAPEHDPIGHLEVAANADAFLVAPASANTIAKLASGVADSMLTTSFLACTAPRLVAPAMNDRMYADAATQANLDDAARARRDRDRARDTGALASRGEWGAGRLPAPEQLLEAVEAAAPGADRRMGRPAGAGHRRRYPRADRPGALHRQPLQRPDGSCRSPSAPARAEREVTLVAANVSLPAPAGVERIDVETTAELAAAVRAEFSRCHVLVMAAAVADFTPGALEPGQAGPRRERRPGAAPERDRGHPRRRSPPIGRRTRRWSALPPSTGPRRSPAPGRSSSARASTRSSSTTCRRRRSASTRPRTR